MVRINVNSVKKVQPQCYAYVLPTVPEHAGYTKIGYTERDVETRIKEQTHTAGLNPVIKWHMLASFVTDPMDMFTDKDFHKYLKKLGVKRREGTEWFEIDPDQAKSDYRDFTENHGEIELDKEEYTSLPYKLRYEQKSAVSHAARYFESHQKSEFLWNAKPRFGKTLATYDLCKRIKAKNVLVVTNRPAIANSWYSDYETFLGPTSGYLFVSEIASLEGKKYVYSRKDYTQFLIKNNADGRYSGCIEFVSLQDLKGSIEFGGYIEKLQEVRKTKWDILVIDEAHEGVDTYKTDVAFENIERKYTLHLSGTPFKALANDKFADEAIFNWTYADEQKAKRNWDNSLEEENPYTNLPQLNLFTYQMSEIVRDKLSQGIQLADNDIEEYAFDLNEFFATNESGKFVHDKDVNRFLDALTQQEKFPFSTPELRDELKHTFWLLNRVASAKALAKKLEMHPVFKDYAIVLAAGDGKRDEDDASVTEDAFNRVKKAIQENDKTITLSVGQLTTGVTIPEWTAVLMLSNMSSPALYMQAAFRAQNPCLFETPQGALRKENAYIFDFDPARTLNIVEKYANDLIPSSSHGDSTHDRKQRIQELLNFFPVYGEDSEGVMVELDPESVLSIPRRIHAREVVDRGFMSNFLFSNISAIFGAPQDLVDSLSQLEAIEEPKKLTPVHIDSQTSESLHLNSHGEVDISESVAIGLQRDIFGDHIYRDIDDAFKDNIKEKLSQAEKENESAIDDMRRISQAFAAPQAKEYLNATKKHYGNELSNNAIRQVDQGIKRVTNRIVQSKHGQYTITRNKLEQEKQAKLYEAQSANASMEEITQISDEYDQKKSEARKEMLNEIHEELTSSNTIDAIGQTVAKTVETERRTKQKESIEKDIRDHLRGFTRTIPAFLMAYGTEETSLANFDEIIDPQTFQDVTSISVERFRQMRDGYDYYDEENNLKHFDGHLFDEVVFNDSVQEFLTKRHALANYFDESQKSDIFDYIPHQKTNQIFTPKKVVIDMVDRLEQENPGCFDNPDKTFADLYMKSGMYISQIVTRLYRSEKMKEIFPDDVERLNHIFAKQVFGCAPTQIIYDICRRYILGFSEDIRVEKDNIRLCDTLELAKEGNMEEKLKEVFEL
ncbi:DEAD/DEAH box helicase family protein [Alloscardovia macacae]|uniref:Type II restriction endonuclease n=1 Tax=Alloscardovia macacae TaxID=1160091 RepID=A0A261F285_9BIFI|nr:DEAD/DEAH box helicase family protein [Alloscardovia macacae]OZG53211.1 type II restriction endonuclease [Alloscardovia macacae]